MHQQYYSLTHHLQASFCAVLVQFPALQHTREIQLFKDFLFNPLFLLFFKFSAKMKFLLQLSYRLTFLLYQTLMGFFENSYCLKCRFFKMDFENLSIYCRLLKKVRESDLYFYKVDQMNFIDFYMIELTILKNFLLILDFMMNHFAAMEASQLYLCKVLDNGS